MRINEIYDYIHFFIKDTFSNTFISDLNQLIAQHHGEFNSAERQSIEHLVKTIELLQTNYSYKDYRSIKKYYTLPINIAFQSIHSLNEPISQTPIVMTWELSTPEAAQILRQKNKRKMA